MLTNPLIVPTILPTGSLVFAEVAQEGRAQDVIDTLIDLPGVKEQILGDFEDNGWALQRIRVEQSGRVWEEDELLSLGDGKLVFINSAHKLIHPVGTVQSSTLVAPLVNAPPATSEYVQRHFSSFPMTAHLHNPVLRLVSLHPQLSCSLAFLRVPEIHDGFEYKVFVSRTMTVSDVIHTVIEELGLARSLPVPGGKFEYVLEEAWIDRDSQSQFYLYVYL